MRRVWRHRNTGGNIAACAVGLLLALACPHNLLVIILAIIIIVLGITSY